MTERESLDVWSEEPKFGKNGTPWGKTQTVVTTDNVIASKVRYKAMQAVENGTATMEQLELLEDCDRVMREAIENMGSNK